MEQSELRKIRWERIEDLCFPGFSAMMRYAHKMCPDEPQMVALERLIDTYTEDWECLIKEITKPNENK